VLQQSKRPQSHLHVIKERDLSNEKGSIVMLAFFCFIMLLLVVGFAIDAGNLYQIRLRLQKAADAGAIAGMASTVFQSELFLPLTTGTGTGSRKEFVETRATQVARQNAMDNGVTLGAGSSVTSTYSRTINAIDTDGNISVTVTIQTPIPFILINRVPANLLGLQNAGDSLVLTTTAQVRRPPANVVLMLDNSNSMSCQSNPAAGDNCACLTPQRGAAVCPATDPGSKLAKLRESVNLFKSKLDSDFDRLAIIPFNIAAHAGVDAAGNPVAGRGVQFEPTGRLDTQVDATLGFNDAAINTALANMTSTSNSNVSDALIRAQQEANRVRLFGIDRPPVVYLLLSDGAPTAGRLLFNNAKAALPNNNLGAGAKDYMMYTVYWTPAPTAAVPNPIPYPAPSPIIATQDMPIDYALPNPPSTPAGATPPSSIRRCNAAEVGGLESDSTKYSQLVDDCLNTFRADMPDATGGTFLNEFTPTVNFPNNWQRMFYNYSLLIMDYLRNNNGTMHIIGFGKPAAIGNSVGGNPYQSGDLAETNLNRKDVFLSRGAYDPSHSEGRTITNPDGTITHNPYPEFSFNGYQTYSQLNADDRLSTLRGRYYPVTDASQLPNAFERAALDIILRLVQ
jgi:Putative Flp pilus-assembly TadE/G-like